MSRYQTAYADQRGPGDSRPTALEIVHNEGLSGRLADKVIFVTGANQGLGLETTRALYTTGATIYLGVRDLSKGQEAIDDIVSSCGSNGSCRGTLRLIHLSLDSLASVKSAASDFLAQRKNLNILILNAGVMATPKGRTEDGFETQFGTNHLGHFLLYQLLRPTLLASASPVFNSRVISVASAGHRYSEVRFHDLHFEEPDSYKPHLAYGQSKTANIYLANEIERRYGSRGLHALSLHPGGVITSLSRNLDPELVKKMSEGKNFMMNAQQGAATTVYAAIGREWEGRGGRYLAKCVEQGPLAQNSSRFEDDDVGYAPWAYDVDKASKLWDISCELVHVPKDD